MLVTPRVNNQGLDRCMVAGDILSQYENAPVAVDGASNFTYAATDIVTGDLAISGGAAVAGTLPTADQLIKALQGNLNKLTPPGNELYGIQPNIAAGPLQWPANVSPVDRFMSFRRSFINNNSNTVTQTAPATAGVTITGTATIATVVWREYLIRILNASPTILLIATTTNTSKVLSNIDKNLIANVTPGMSVYGTGIGASAKVTAVNLDAGTISVDVASTATADNIAVTFTPTVVYQNIRAGAV